MVDVDLVAGQQIRGDDGQGRCGFLDPVEVQMGLDQRPQTA